MIGTANPDVAIRGLWCALAIDAVGHLGGLAFAEGDPDTIRGAWVLGLVLPAVLAFFIWRQHQWPRWYLAIAGGIALVASVASLMFYGGATRDIVLGVVAAAELGVLARTWPSSSAQGL